MLLLHRSQLGKLFDLYCKMIEDDDKEEGKNSVVIETDTATTWFILPQTVVKTKLYDLI